MASKPRQHPDEYKAQAVRLMREPGRTVRGVARELGVNEGLLYRWEAQLKQSQPASSARTDIKAEREELLKLRGENARLKQELDFLRQAAAYFAKERK